MSSRPETGRLRHLSELLTGNLAPSRTPSRLSGERVLFFFNADHAMLRGQDFGVEAVGISIGPPVVNGCGRNVETIANSLMRQVLSIQPDGPYLLAGYCFGGIVAYEIARMLIESGCKVDHLFLIETPHPEPLRRLGLIRSLLLTLKSPLTAVCAVFRRVNAKVKRVNAKVKSCRQRCDIIRDHIFEDHLQATSYAVSRFPFRPYRGKINLVFGSHSRYRFFAKEGWNQVATLGVDVHVVRGGHDLHTLLDQRGLSRLISSRLILATNRFSSNRLRPPSGSLSR